MRVPMGEVVDIRKDFTVGNLSIGQKISVIWESMIADSKILGKQRKQEEEKEIKKRNDIFDSLKNGILASLMFHLVENKTLSEFNQEATELHLVVAREYEKILAEVLLCQEFNVYDWWMLRLDNDLVNSFGNAVPIGVAFRQKEVRFNEA
ncbi:hypothetical protein AGMMS49975_09990 [Clostridia bacterium]|nr:hypothetical protein AGMMS49975_09990 [Clostridia bacterium]